MSVPRVLGALAFRSMARNPVTVVGLGLAAALVWLHSSAYVPVMHRDTAYLPTLAAPLAVAALLAAHAVARRDRLARMVDLYGALPSTPEARTAGYLTGAAWYALVIGGGFAAAVLVYWRVVLGGVWWPEPFDLAAVPLALLAGAAVGVALARWAPPAMAAPLGLLVVASVHLWLFESGRLERLSLLGDSPPPGHLELWVHEPGVHLAYTLGASVLLAAVALARHRPGPATGTAGVAGALVAVAAGALLLQPPTAEEVAAIRGLLTGEDHLVCTDGVVEVCSPPPFAGWHGWWQRQAAGVFETWPGPAPERDIRIVADFIPSHVIEEVRHDVIASSSGRALTPRGVLLAEPRRRRGEAGDRQAFGVALHVVRELMGFGGYVPVPPHVLESRLSDDAHGTDGPPSSESPCTAAGQAREVVAMYLAATASPEARRGLEGVLAADSRPALDLTWAGLDRRTAMFWSRDGVRVAQELARMDEARVAGELAADWRRWLDPATSTQALAGRFSISAAPPATEGASGVPPPRDAHGPCP